MKLFYERIGCEFRTRPYQCRAYYSVEHNQNVMVLFPFHYAVQFAWWLNMQWSRYRYRKSWIDTQIKAGIYRERGERWP